MTGSDDSPNPDEDRTLESRMKDFKKVTKDLMNDLLTTFPELGDNLDTRMRNISQTTSPLPRYTTIVRKSSQRSSSTSFTRMMTYS